MQALFRTSRIDRPRGSCAVPIVSPLWLLGAALAGQPVPGLEQIMAHPDWVARSPRAAGCGLDSRTVWYRRKQAGSEQVDWWSVGTRSATPVQHGETAREQALTPGGETRPDGRYRVKTVDGAVWMVDRKGQARALTTAQAGAQQSRFLTNGRVAWRQDQTWVTAALDGTAPAALVTLALRDDPAHPSTDSFLEAQQLRLFSTLARARDEDERLHTRDTEQALLDPFTARTVYLGDNRELEDQSRARRGLAAGGGPPRSQPERDPMPGDGVGYVRPRSPSQGGHPHPRRPLGWLVPVDRGEPIAVNLDNLPIRSDDPRHPSRAPARRPTPAPSVTCSTPGPPRGARRPRCTA